MTANPVCDFCHDPSPRWAFPARTVTFDDLETTSVGDWLACDECAALIQAGDADGLARRALRNPSVKLLWDIAGGNTEGVTATIRDLHDGFRKSRTGEPRSLRQ